MARSMRHQSTFVSFSYIYTLLRSVNALIVGADFFQVQQPEVCQVYTLLGSAVVIETFVPSNTVLSHPACGCEITVTNAPTVLSTTLAITKTLGQNALPASSTNLPASNGPHYSHNPTLYYISVAEIQKRESLQDSQYLKSDGSLTTSTSDAVQVYESSGQLFAVNGTSDGTYFTYVNVETITFAPLPPSFLTSTTIAGYFSLGSMLAWEHDLFTNSKADFALSPEGLVKAIFNGNYPPGFKRIGLVLRHVENILPIPSVAGGFSNIGNSVAALSTAVSRASLTAPLTVLPFTLQDLPSPIIALSSITPQIIEPNISTTKTTFSIEFSTSLSMTKAAPVTLPEPPSPLCTALSLSAGDQPPNMIGLASLASPPNWPFLYTSDNATFSVTFESQTTLGSLGYAELNPSTPPNDSILYYQLNASSTPSTTSICQTWGYLYHQQSGLCLTALQNTTNPTTSGLYQGGNVALEPCMICNQAPGLPESDQLFCAVQEDGTLGKWYCIDFMGDDVQGLGYGVLYQDGVVNAVLQKDGGDCIYVAAL